MAVLVRIGIVLGFWTIVCFSTLSEANSELFVDCGPHEPDPQVKLQCEQIENDLKRLGELRFEHPSKALTILLRDSNGSPEQYVRRYLKRVTVETEDIVIGETQLAGASNCGILFMPAYFEADEATRLGTLIHESTHLRPDGAPHMACPENYSVTIDGKFFDLKKASGKGSCDSSSNGAYGAGYIFERALSMSCENCSDEERAQAEKRARETLLHFPSAQVRQSLIESTSQKN